MEIIKDAIPVYSFLGQLGLFGSIMLSLLLTSVGFIFTTNVADKITSKERSAKWLTTVVSGVILGSMIALSILSTLHQTKIDKANAIKAYMISQKQNWAGIREIARDVYLSMDEKALGSSNNKQFPKRVDEVRDIINEFPDEFEISKIRNIDASDTLGIELIDTSAARALNKYYEELTPFILAKISHYLDVDERCDSISYHDIRVKIDDRFQDYILDMALSQNLKKDDL